MKIKWQWFIGGRIMFWVSIITLVILILTIVFTYVIDLTTIFSMTIEKIDTNSIQKISEDYVKQLGIELDKPVTYRFVQYKENGKSTRLLLGTFHEWNKNYYIDISVELNDGISLRETVIHETRHMIVRSLRCQKVIDLEKYTEEIAQQTNPYCNQLFNAGVNLLKK